MIRPQIYLRPWIWLNRFRHRRGYGVHSPFAFNFITSVCYERLPYYKYAELIQTEKALRDSHGKEWSKSESLKVKRLLFRLVNRTQPHTLVETGQETSATLYMQAAKSSMQVFRLCSIQELQSSLPSQIDFLYLRHATPTFMEATFTRCLTRCTPNSVFVVRGIHRDKATKQLWKRMKQQAVVTFDLYELGILFFNENYFKQDYIVNF